MNNKKALSKKNIKKTTNAQFDVLVREMAKRPDAARGYAFGHKRDKVDADWREIVDLLNDLGPPVRNLSEWKKVWSDLRKRLQNRLNGERTGRTKKKLLDSHEFEFVKDTLTSQSLYSLAVAAANEYNEDDCFKHATKQEHHSTTDSQPFETHSHLEEMEFQPATDTDYEKVFLYPETEDPKLEEKQEKQMKTTNLENSLFAVEKHMKEQCKLFEQLTKINTSIANAIERQVTATEKQNEVLERQAKAMESQTTVLTALMELWRDKLKNKETGTSKTMLWDA
ncbi:uncharacterized protein ACN427_014713 [Glossina fuscipes fuscipes]